MKTLLALAGAAALTFASPAAAAATLQVSGSGILTGATGVNVGGTLYDVEFVDGSCASLFGGCDSNSDFAFQTSASALLAAQALLDQVLVNVTGGGQFDSSPSLTFGCSFSSCLSYIPYSTADVLGVAIARNGTSEAGDIAGGPASAPLDFRTDDYIDSNFARFTLSAQQAVPEPATWAMMLLGFVGIGIAVRRSRKPSLAQVG